MNEEWIVKQLEKIEQFSQIAESFQTAEKIHQCVVSLMTEAGCKVRVDQVGNIIGRLETISNSDCPCVITGSSLETGMVGILTAIAAAQTLKSQEFSYPIEVIAFAGEKYRPFGISMVGSKVLAGTLSTRTLCKAKDQQGLSLAEFLSRQGLDIKNIDAASLSRQYGKAFIELHIEQLPFMETEGLAIGIAETIVGATRCKITVSGRSLPVASSMGERQDALVSASMIILAIQEIGQDSEHDISASVSDLKVIPGPSGFIPESVEIWLEIHSTKQESIIETLQEIKDAVSTISESQETTVSIEMLAADKPIKLCKEVIAVIEEVCQDSMFTYRNLNSTFRCDAANISNIIPAGLILIPQTLEKADTQVLRAGLTVLTKVLNQLAK